MNEIIQSSVYTTQKGTPVTDSVKVAQVFGKMHKNIMKSIRNILGSAQNLAHQNWFAETTYMDGQGKRQPRQSRKRSHKRCALQRNRRKQSKRNKSNLKNKPQRLHLQHPSSIRHHHAALMNLQSC